MKILLITQREETNQYGDTIESLEASYVHYFTSLGFAVLSVTNFSKTLQHYFNLKPNGIVLTGGGMLTSSADSYEKHGHLQENRDYVERELVKYALKTQIPVLGICRGMQQINNFLNGHTSLLCNLPEERWIGVEHSVTMKGNTFNVNNYHNYGVLISGIGRGLESLAIDESNGVIEALWAPGILGVQWHPERIMMDIVGRKITDSLIESFLNGYFSNEEALDENRERYFTKS